MKHEPPAYGVIQLCLILTGLTKGIRGEHEMKDVWLQTQTACNQLGKKNEGELTRECAHVAGLLIYRLYRSHE